MRIGEKKRELVVKPDFLPIEPDEEPESQPVAVPDPVEEPAEVKRER